MIIKKNNDNDNSNNKKNIYIKKDINFNMNKLNIKVRKYRITGN